MKKLLGVLSVAIILLFSPVISAEEEINDEELAATIETPADEGLAVDDDAEGQSEPEMPAIKDQTVYSGLVNIKAGYTLLSVKAVNDFLSSYKSSALGGGAQIISEQNMDGAITASIDIGFIPFAQLPVSLGLKAAYVKGNTGLIESSDTGIKEKYSFDTTVIPLMAGGSYELVIKEVPVSLIADAYFGYAFAGGMLTREVSSPGLKEEAMFGGGGFAAEFGLKINYRIMDALSAGLSAGYSLASAGEMAYSADADIDAVEINKGDKVVNIFDSNSQMLFDFSGVTIGINVNMLY